MRIWAEVSLDALEKNIGTVRSLTDRDICAVVKADGYGHGAVPVARKCEEMGLRYLAVATAGEGMALRHAGIDMPILVLGYTPPAEAAALAEAGLTQTVFDLGQAEALSSAVGEGRTLRIHVKLDTGMSRLGLRSVGEVCHVCRLPGLDAEGFFTHYATADAPDDQFAAEQTARFDAAVASLGEAGVRFKILHCANSGGVIYYPKGAGNMARVGLLLYGWPPSGEYDPRFEPVMRFCATVAQVKRVAPGETVSYGRAFTASRPTDIAVLCCGYADGYHRALSNKGCVLIAGRRAPVVGNVCMDMMMTDVTGIPVRAGDTAVLFGRGGGGLLPLGELAGLAGTIPYELMCAVSARVPRVYV